MKRQLLIVILTLLTATMGHAADIVVDGVTYVWSQNEWGYIATGWDEETPIQSLHIHGTVNGLDVVGIANYAFDYNEDIVYLTVDEGILYIGENAFSRCTNLKTAILPEGLVTIKEEAFNFCTALTTVVIPSTVKEIQSHAFSNCTGVTDVYFLMTDVDLLNGNFSWWDGTTIGGGGMEFNTSENTVVHVPDGMLQDYEDSGKFDAWLPMQEDGNTYPLWWIVNYGVLGREYTVADALTGVYVDVNDCLYAKDDNHWLTPDRAYPGEVDYMKATGLLASRGGEYDQSNWVVLEDVTSPNDFVGYVINAETITGVLLDKQNPAIDVTADPERGGQQNYAYNTYVPASLMSRTQVGSNDRIYAFVRPKPQEVANYEWTIYGGNDDFYMPAPDAENNINNAQLMGGFTISDALYDGFMPDLEDGGYYPFSAITHCVDDDEDHWRSKKAESAYWDPFTDSGIAPYFTVYPLTLPEEPIVTSTPTILRDHTNSTQRYNLWGQPVSADHKGIVIHNGKLHLTPPHTQ